MPKKVYVKDPRRYKTKLCQNMFDSSGARYSGICPFLHRCQFAHSYEELRSVQAETTRDEPWSPSFPPSPRVASPPPSVASRLPPLPPVAPPCSRAVDCATLPYRVDPLREVSHMCALFALAGE